MDDDQDDDKDEKQDNDDVQDNDKEEKVEIDEESAPSETLEFGQFSFTAKKIKDGKKFFSLQDGKPITYMTVLEYLRDKADFRKAFISVNMVFIQRTQY